MTLFAYDHEKLRYLLPSTEGGAVSFRRRPEGFVVDELPLFDPSGAGEHLFLRIEKRGIGTPAVVRALRETYGLKEPEIGYAGQKDAHGVTSQWVSVPARAVDDEGARLASWGEGGLRVLDAKLHDKKLRLGMLSGNRFRIEVEGDLPGLDVVEARAALLMERGMPNYFGAQRFGFGQDSLEGAMRFFSRKKRPKSRRERFWISSLQSALFNTWLDQRVGDGLLFVAIDGDVLALRGRASNFECTDPAADTPRVEAGEVVPTGPMWGRKMRPPDRDALTRESRSLTDLGLDPAMATSHPGLHLGERRASRVFPGGVECTLDEGRLVVAMTLPKGSYATVFLRELIGRELADGAFRERPPATADDAEA